MCGDVIAAFKIYGTSEFEASSHKNSLETKAENMHVQENVGTIILTQPMVQVGALYKHYSGKVYKIIAIAHHSENPQELMVVYQGLYDCPSFGKNPMWCRPYTMFVEHVDINGKQQPRFALVEEKFESA
jgi:hypothetical protein